MQTHYCIIYITQLFTFTIIFIDYFILGVSSIQPWGIIQRHCFKKKTRNNLIKKLSESGPEFSIAIKNNKGEKKHVDLKEFLQHYVVDINWLEKDDPFCKRRSSSVHNN